MTQSSIKKNGNTEKSESKNMKKGIVDAVQDSKVDSPRSSLTEKEVGEIKWLLYYYPKISHPEIGNYYGVNRSVIQQMNSDRTYEHVAFRRPNYNVSKVFETRNRLLKREAGEIKWIFMNLKPRPTATNVANEYGITNNAVIDIKNGKNHSSVPVKKPKDGVINRIRDGRDEKTHRGLKDKRAAEMKWILEKTEILNTKVAEYYDYPEAAIYQVEMGNWYDEVKPKEPNFNPQDEFIRFFGRKCNIYSSSVYKSTLELAEMKWLSENVPIHDRTISDQYNANQLTAYKKCAVWWKVEPRKPDLTEVFDSFNPNG